MEKPGLLNLSDEVLVYIFSYLDGMDKINTYRTCLRFRNIFGERRLSRKLKLIGNYSVTVKDIKCYLKPKMIRENIRILDLTNCYWLPPSEMYNTVLNLKNLVALYVVDVAFTYRQIIKMCSGLNKLEYLSLSWPELTDIEVNDSSLSSLKFLYILVPKVASTNWFHLFCWVCKCKNLELLYLICAPGSIHPTQVYSVVKHNLYSQMALHTLVIVGLQNEYFLRTLKSICRIPSESCKCLWLPTNADAWKEYFSENGDERQYLNLNTTCLESLACENHRVTAEKRVRIKSLYRSIFKPPLGTADEQYENLEQLGVVRCFSITLLQPLHMLTVLCIPGCCFSGLGEQEASLVPKWCPEIQHLEIHYFCEECKDKSKKHEVLLDIIAGWAKLKILKLSDFLDLRSGKAFDKVFQSCKNLEKLFVTDLGAAFGYIFQFTKALNSCKSLKHFRFEDTYVTVAQMMCLIEALAECPLIERVTFLFRNSAKGPPEASVLKLIEKSPKLVFLCIIAPFVTDTQRKKLMKIITKRFMPTHPVLSCCFLKSLTSLESSGKEKLPAIHLFEMLYPDLSGPFHLPYRKDFFFEVPDLDVAATETTL